MAAAGRLRSAFALSAALLVAASFLISYRLGWIGTMTLATRAPRLSLPVPKPGLRVAILRSEATLRFLGAPEDYERHVAFWTAMARRVGGAAEIVPDAALEQDLGPHGVLVLPSAVCLSAKAKAGIRAFVAAGGGVVATWATGSRDEGGHWQGWDFLRGLTGADGFDAPAAPAPWFVAFRGGNPMAAGRPAGARVQVASPERLQATALEVDGYWSDERLGPRDPALPGNFQGAVLHRRDGNGRIAWIGFQENSAVAGGPDGEILDAALLNALAWAGHAPRAEVEPWPWPHPAAVVLALAVGPNPENAGYAVDVLLKAGAPGTFFYVPARIDDARDVPGLARAGEIGWSAPALSASGPVARARQLARIVSARIRLRRGVGAWPSGIARAVVEPESLSPLAGAGFRYALVREPGGSVRPTALAISSELAGVRRESDFALLVATAADDLHLSPLGLVGLDADWVARRVLSDFGTVRGLGGLYVLAYHSQGLSAPEYAPVLRRLVDDWRSGGAWVAKAGEIAEWWLARSRVAVAVSGAEGLLHVEIDAPASVPAGLTVSVFPAAGFSAARLEPPGPGAAAPQVVADPASGCVRLVLGPLGAHDTRRYDIRLDP